VGETGIERGEREGEAERGRKRGEGGREK